MREAEAVPPDARRCLPVRVADVPLEQRVDAIRKFSQDFVDDPAERLTLFDLALNPGELVAWVAPATSNGGNGKRRKTSVETVERIFDLHEQGLSGSAIAERLDVPHGTVKSIVKRDREEALRRFQQLADEEVARVIRAALRDRLAGWHPFGAARDAGATWPEIRDRAKRAERCRPGHLFDGANTIVTASGARTCRTCRNASALAYYHRSKSAAF